MKTGKGNRESMGWMGRNGVGWLGKKWELGRWRRKKKRMAGHGRAELRVHIGAFSNFYIAFVAAPTPRITCPFLCFIKVASACLADWVSASALLVVREGILLAPPLKILHLFVHFYVSLRSRSDKLFQVGCGPAVVSSLVE